MKRISQVFEELFRGEIREEHQPDRGEELDFEGANVSNVGEVESEAIAVGGSGPVTAGPMADSGEWVILSDARYQGGPWTTTSTTYEHIIQGNSKVTLPIPRMSNVAEYAVGFSTQMRNQNTDETTDVRLRDAALRDAVASVTGGWSPSQSTKASLGADPDVDAVQADVEMRCTGGTAELEQITLHVWGRIA